MIYPDISDAAQDPAPTRMIRSIGHASLARIYNQKTGPRHESHKSSESTAPPIEKSEKACSPVTNSTQSPTISTSLKATNEHKESHHTIIDYQYSTGYVHVHDINEQYDSYFVYNIYMSSMQYVLNL